MEFAIVGASIRLPGVCDIDEFRRALLAGQSGLCAVPPSSDDGKGPTVHDPRYVPVASVVESAELFDREFFSMTSGEAASLDPQQRLLLTLAYEALQSCAFDPEMRRIGVYVSATQSSRRPDAPARQQASGPLAVDYSAMLANDTDFCSARIAHKLGLTGPAVTVQSACSSALVAVHQACAGLAFGDADAAIAGGVSVTLPQNRGYLHQEGGVLSPTGQCRPFDRGADGFVKGNGGALVVLRRLDDALADGDPVLAVISGSAVNNDGDRRMGFTAPSPQGQEELIASAVARSGVAVGDIRYVEAHGTGTPMGDPIEFRALTRAYGAGPGASPDCCLGSLKANYGHLDVAAGAVGLVKAVLVVHGGTVFPQINFTGPSEFVPLAAGRFVIPTEPRQFPEHSWAAVSAFGMGGTNAHVVLRGPRDGEISPVRAGQADGCAVPVRFNARSERSLARFGSRLSRYLRERPDIHPADVAATLARRSVGGLVREVRARDSAELADELAAQDFGVARETIAAVPGRRVWLPPTPLEEAPLSSSGAVSEPGGAERTPAPRAAQVRASFMRHVEDELGPPVGEEDDFFAAGGESIGLVAIVAKVTAEFGFVVDFTRLDGLSTVGKLADELVRQAVSTVHDTDPIITFGPPGDVYWHPPAGGANFCYSALSRVCPKLGVNAFRANLRDTASTIEDIAARNIEVLDRRGLLGGQLVLGGYSFGGNVGLEMAIQLERAGVQPRRVVLFDSIAPHGYRGADTTGEEYDKAVALMVQSAVRQSAPEDQLGAFSRMLGDQGSAAGVLYQDFVRFWRANHQALVRHKPEAVLSCPITLFRSQEALPQQSLQWLGVDALPASAWQRYSAQPLQVINVPGDHYALFVEPQCLEVLAARLPEVLGRNA
ncbi:6-deoxyerythronolide-B synthase [Segniliparus rotundus DSM 44985]|uniref:6-deoxyerythronolide-B synthase n=1 Tax=Segniliparus rotundus (strain ATCC BAA-972 / CDC 1076 / CIP 108378 / DSM 44985 / JCM 13578) TaxID=640132 RepID=D6Z779_SEGRD|nr:beta-ketoacyl synthase N-terminal-like domain-containing protein [Segniliparus rotundus]ADG97809.1 6-deoxyerythronolide-B synthase [Segniliparus rotundus DSM 44985]